MRPESDKPAPKPRHIVSWTTEEDELLREQVSAHGTDSWTSIAAKFKDKTSRQCRRRWYTYLNSEGKKGGWSAEEDMILCEAQKIFGNRWTEIAKVVSGRTDNAVKNRFSTLCKKRAKSMASTKENSSWVNPNNKRVIIRNDSFMPMGDESLVPTKQIRYQISDDKENQNPDDIFCRQPAIGEVQLRSPLSVLGQNIKNASPLQTQYCPDKKTKSATLDGSGNKIEGSFLKRDDPKLSVLLQQAELLSSLALKVNSENTSLSLENAWKEFQDYLTKIEGSGIASKSPESPDLDFLLDDFKDLMEDLRSGSAVEQLLWRQTGFQEESQDNTLSIQATQSHQNDIIHCDETILNQNAIDNCHQEEILGLSISTSHGALPSSEEAEEIGGGIYSLFNSEFDSPCQTIPTFKSLSEGIPSPKFSSSERQFLLSVLGISPCAPSSNAIQQPSCKRVLLDSL